MERVYRQEYFVNNFLKFNKQQQRALLKNLDEDQLKLLIELCRNLLDGCPIFDLKKLKKIKKCHIKNIRCMGCAKKSLKRKAKIVKTKGSFLPAILGALAGTTLSTLLESAISNLKKNEPQK